MLSHRWRSVWRCRGEDSISHTEPDTVTMATHRGLMPHTAWTMPDAAKGSIGCITTSLRSEVIKSEDL